MELNGTGTQCNAMQRQRNSNERTHIRTHARNATGTQRNAKERMHTRTHASNATGTQRKGTHAHTHARTHARTQRERNAKERTHTRTHARTQRERNGNSTQWNARSHAQLNATERNATKRNATQTEHIAKGPHQKSNGNATQARTHTRTERIATGTQHNGTH